MNSPASARPIARRLTLTRYSWEYGRAPSILHRSARRRSRPMLREFQARSAAHVSADRRPSILRLSIPPNQRPVSVAPNRRRSLSRRSAFLKYRHEQLVGAVQPISGRRGAARRRYDLPMACFAAIQHIAPGAISTARKSPLLFGRLELAIRFDGFAGRWPELLPNSAFRKAIMTSPR